MSAETVTVTLEIPRPVAEWFKDPQKPIEKRLADELVELCLSQIDGSTKKSLIDKYNLGPVLEQYGLT